MVKQLSELLGPETSAATVSNGIQISGLTADSRAVQPGHVFAALSGSKTDGARFIADAVAKGALAVLAAEGVAIPPGPAVVRAKEPRQALAKMAARFYGPGPKTIVAVTGTNGKTSVAEFTRQIFAACGRQAASLGTIGIVKPDGGVYGSLTTPDPVTLHRTLAELAAEGVTHLALEASSHGLDQFRLDGVELSAAAFNNLGRDHLDYHPTMAAYLEAKLRLFRELMQPGQPVVVNQAFVDDETLNTVDEAVRGRGLKAISSGLASSTLALEMLHREGDGQGLLVSYDGQAYNVRLDLVGAYQAQNALVAAGLAIACGEDPAIAINAIAQLKGVKGRLETVGKSVAGGLVLVDYAHKPEALAAALSEIRKFMGSAGKLICVFGCGGDRDRGKRPIMGRIARELADAVIVTDDNPRSEQPAAIRQEIVSESAHSDALARIAIKQYWGQPRAGRVVASEIGDRAEAIRAGVAMLGRGDVLLVAGKGHETGQIVGDKVLPFSDQDEVRKALVETAA